MADNQSKNCNVLLRQINLHHCRMAAADIAQLTSGWKTFLMCVQEPHIDGKGRPVGLPRTNNIIFQRDKRPRALLVGSPDLDLWPCPDFMSPDLAVGLWRTGKTDLPEIYVASAYLDITDKEIVPLALKKLVQYCHQEGKQLLICADMNAHSPLWGCDNENQRGLRIEEFIFSHRLEVLNTGTRPTWRRGDQNSIIDVTLATTGVTEVVEKWRVDETDHFSDHHLIEFQITISKADVYVRNWYKGDFDLFQTLLEENEWTPDGPWTVEKLDKEVSSFVKACNRALEEACPKRVRRGHCREFSWWNEDLMTARLEARRKHRKFVHLKRKNATSEGISSAMEAWKESRRSYDRLISKSKKLAWRRFVTETTDAKGMANLVKIVQRKENHSLGILNDASGNSVLTPEATVSLLLDEHFPGSQVNPVLRPWQPVMACHKEDLENITTFTIPKIKEAIKSFGSHKAAGPDGFKPIMLKSLGPKALERLMWIFRISLKLGKTPLQWQESTVIFIPKPGKKDYSHVRSFRPISLTSFFFKTMERLVLWELEEGCLKTNPMNKHQHAFRRGHSTDSALTDMVDNIEAGMLRNEYVLGVFLDIEGAFDNLDPQAAIRGMKSKGFPDLISRWYGNYLLNRRVSTIQRGSTSSRFLTKGTPQGGVISPIIWNIAFDEFLQKFDSGPVKGSFFADDAGLHLRGPVLSTLVPIMQDKIDEATDWGAKCGLKFSAPKTIAVVFTRRRVQNPPTLTMGGVEITYSKSVRYLGVQLDSKLLWNEHIDQKIKVAKRKMMLLKGVVGRIWGTSPAITRWAYLQELFVQDSPTGV